MQRFMVSLLAFLGALNLAQREGRADPPVGSSVAKAATGAPSKRDAKLPAKTEGEASSTNGRETRARVKQPTYGYTHSNHRAGGQAGKGAAGSPAWARGQPGVVKLVRGAETLEVRVLDRRQRLVPATLPQFAHFLRAKSGADHPIDGRLVTLLATVSDHFGGREVNVVSGFRPYSARQHARHSNHNQGRAVDFSIKGVANETVRDFCRTLRDVGVGYYPNSLFIHIDVRQGNAYWVDYAAPGQAPRYHPPDGKDGGKDDEGDGIASVEGGSSGPAPTASPREAPRADVTRGGERASTGERGVFVNR